jgi:thiol-disulfide isomerase/thioredoxin
MDFTIYIVGGLMLTWGAYMAYMWLSTQAMRGRQLDSLSGRIPELAHYPERVLIYCYTRACPPCRSMTPIIDQLRKEGHPIIKIDLGEDRDLAMELGVRATPSLLLVEHGQIQYAGLGAKSRRQILHLLQA